MKQFSGYFLAASLFTAFALAAQASNAQDLFSSERLSGQEIQGSKNVSTIDDRELKRVIERAGYEVVQVHAGNVYEIEKEEGEWTFPVLVELSPDGSNLWATFVLQEFTGRLEDHAVRFSKLLALNGKYGNVFFKFDTETRMMMLVGSRPNQNVTPSVMDDLLSLLGSIAVENDRLWKMAQAPVEPSMDEQVVGSWLHQDNDRSMKLSFRSNGRFTATLTEDGRSNSFSGTYSLGSQTLDLVSDEGEEFALPLVSLTRRNMTLDLDGMELVLVRR